MTPPVSETHPVTAGAYAKMGLEDEETKIDAKVQGAENSLPAKEALGIKGETPVVGKHSLSYTKLPLWKRRIPTHAQPGRPIMCLKRPSRGNSGPPDCVGVRTKKPTRTSRPLMQTSC